MLGDRVAQALASVGVTEERVSRWVGNCRCAERRERLNALDLCARAALRDNVASAKSHLLTLLGLD